MFKNFFTSAYRNLRKQKFYAFINIAGLAIGVACCLLIVLFVVDELSYDNFHEKGDRIYRVGADMKFGEMDGQMAVLPAPLAPTLMADFPEVEKAARFRERGRYLVKKGNDPNISEEGIIFADQEVFEVFTLPLLQGDKAMVLTEPQTAVISASMAEKFFNGEDPIGQSLTLDNSTDYRIVGVMQDIPSNSHFHFNMFLAMPGLKESKEQVWLSHNFATYVVLKEGVDPKSLEAKFPQMLETYAGPQVKKFLDQSIEEFQNSGNRLGYFLQPLDKIYLHSDMLGELGHNSDATYVYIFSAIALFILLLACINFMNLATARSAQRAKEVGVRKVLGSTQKQLIGQFLFESLILSIIAFLVAVGISLIALPFFNELSLKEMRIPFTPGFILLYFGMAVIIGLIAGIYPSFFLSAYKPVEVLKGQLTRGSGSAWLRKSLVVFQFATSIILIIGTMVVYRQLHFIQHKKLGFNKEKVFILQDTFVLKDQVQTFKQEVLKMPEVVSASVSGHLPVLSSRNNSVYWLPGKSPQESSVIIENWNVDHDYVKTMGMEILEGRDFSQKFPTDSSGVLLNETAAKQFGLGDDPVGKEILTYEDLDSESGEVTVGTYKVIGLIKNFHFESLRQNVAPLGLFLGNSNHLTSFRLQTDNPSEVIAGIQSKWEEFAPGQPFEYSFLDDRFDRVYRTETRLGKIFAGFAGLAIFVACLGLFALASFTAERRTKEIGIRKVLGASVSNIVQLLTKDFIVWVLIALAIAIPVGWGVAYYWLEGFAYKAPINPLLFLAAGVIAIAIAVFTVSFQSIRAAMTNPADILKDE